MPAPLGAFFGFAVLRESCRNNEKTRQTVNAVRFTVARCPTNHQYKTAAFFALRRCLTFSCSFLPRFQTSGQQKAAPVVSDCAAHALF
jgi:hypothetical protein